MHGVTVCRSCGRTIKNDFVYCPWCGKAAMEEEFELTGEPLFQQVAYINQRPCGDRLFKLEYSLNRLEADLSRFISQNGE